MGKKRKRYQDHTAGMDYNLPTPKSSGRTSRATSFKPNENEFRGLLNSAFKSRLSRLIQAYLKQDDSKSKNDNLKDVEQKRRKVPPGTFEALDDQYGTYWSANTCRRLKLNTLSLYGSYVQNNFDNLLDTIKENQNNSVPEEEEDARAFVQEEQIRSIVVLLGQIVRKYLPPNMRATIIEKLNSAIIQYSDFACTLSFMVHAIMINFTMFDNNTTVDLDTIIPIEFQTDSGPVSLPAIPTIPTSSDVTYNDYKNLFSFTHLQVISTLNFGTTGVQSKTLTNHPLWDEIHKRTKSKTSSSQVENAALQTDEDNVDQQFQEFIDLAKSVNTTIKKSVVKQLSTNLDNMYIDNKKFNKTLDKLLLVLLKMNFQSKKERERRIFMNQQHDNQKAPVSKTTGEASTEAAGN
ncbi:unnamed protein product [Rhizopus stolonifer]